MPVPANDPAKEIVQFLIAKRKELKLKQKEVAQRLHCSQSRLSKLENGTLEICLNDIHRYAAALGLKFNINFV